MKLCAIVCTTLLVAACGKSKSSSHADDQPPPTKTTEPAATKPPEPKAEPMPPIAAAKGIFGCHAKDPAAAMTKRKPATPWQLPFTFAGCPSLPSEIYGTADFGMDGETAGKAAKARVDGTSAYIYLGKSPFRYQFTFRVDEDTHTVDKFTFKIDQEAFDEIKAGWGDPVVYEHLSDKYNAWYNPEKHLKVTANADDWDRANAKTKQDENIPGYHLYFQRYMPMAEMVGKDGILAKPIIGKTVAELAAAFPEWIEVKSKTQNKAEMDRIGLDPATQAKVESMGGAGDTAMLKLPETETNLYHTLVQPDWEGGKVVTYSILFPFGKDQALKAEILATVAAALGAPTGAKKELDKWQYTFAGPNGTVVTMGMSILDEDWSMRVSAKK